jgi:hypothetical protein
LIGSIETWLVTRTAIPNSTQSLCAWASSMARPALRAGRSWVLGKEDLKGAEIES